MFIQIVLIVSLLLAFTMPCEAIDLKLMVPYPGVTSDGANGLTITGSVSSANTPTQSGIQIEAYTSANDTGAANAYAITVSPAPTLSAYSWFSFKAAHVNTTASTLAVNGGAAKSIKKWGGTTDLVGGEIAVGQIVRVIYDGTNFQMQSQSALMNTMANQASSSVAITGGSITGTSIGLVPVDAHAGLSLTTAQVRGTRLENYGQAASNINSTLSALDGTEGFIVFIGTAQAANYFRITAASAGSIYLDGGTTGKDYVQQSIPVVGSFLTCFPGRTGASTWVLICTTGAGSWTTN